MIYIKLENLVRQTRQIGMIIKRRRHMRTEIVELGLYHVKDFDFSYSVINSTKKKNLYNTPGPCFFFIFFYPFILLLIF